MRRGGYSPSHPNAAVFAPASVESIQLQLSRLAPAIKGRNAEVWPWLERLSLRPRVRSARMWIRILQDVIRAIDKDNCLGLAAQLAFYFLLALFPALLFLVALISYLPVENAMAELLSALGAWRRMRSSSCCARSLTTWRRAAAPVFSLWGLRERSGAVRRPWSRLSTR